MRGCMIWDFWRKDDFPTKWIPMLALGDKDRWIKSELVPESPKRAFSPRATPTVAESTPVARSSSYLVSGKFMDRFGLDNEKMLISSILHGLPARYWSIYWNFTVFLLLPDPELISHLWTLSRTDPPAVDAPWTVWQFVGKRFLIKSLFSKIQFLLEIY